MSYYPWPDREAWAKARRTVYIDDLETTVDGSSGAALSDYASDDEIAQAGEEIASLWRALGQTVRTANAAARTAFPQFKHRVTRPETLNYLAALDALDQRAHDLIQAAFAAYDRRKNVREILRKLDAGYVPRLFEMSHAGDLDAAPTFLAIYGRYGAACEKKRGELYARTAEAPIDDEAWEKELARRAEIEAARAGGNVTYRRG